MPKRLLFALAIAALAIAACNSGSTTTPPSSPPVSPSPNPSIKKALVQVTIAGTPAANIPVEESTPQNPASPRPGTPFDTVPTNKKGYAHFKDLKPSKTYCWVAVISHSIESSECAGWAVWQNSTIFLGTQ